MYILENGNLYVLKGDNLVGVEIYPDRVIHIEGSERPYAGNGRVISKAEIDAKWQIKEGGKYIFPFKPEPIIEVKIIAPLIEIPQEKEVIKNEPTDKVKRNYRKSSRK